MSKLQNHVRKIAREAIQAGLSKARESGLSKDFDLATMALVEVQKVVKLSVIKYDHEVFHFTYTGPNAGEPFCGCDKGIETVKGATFMHVPYSPPSAALLSKLCPECLRMFEEGADG